MFITAVPLQYTRELLLVGYANESMLGPDWWSAVNTFRQLTGAPRASMFWKFTAISQGFLCIWSIIGTSGHLLRVKSGETSQRSLRNQKIGKTRLRTQDVGLPGRPRGSASGGEAAASRRPLGPEPRAVLPGRLWPRCGHRLGWGGLNVKIPLWKLCWFGAAGCVFAADNVGLACQGRTRRCVEWVRCGAGLVGALDQAGGRLLAGPARLLPARAFVQRGPG